MRRWRIVNPPDRWELMCALLQSPSTREAVEFVGQRSGRRFPLHISVEAITHLSDEPLTVIGRLVSVRDRPVANRPHVEVRLWPHLRRGELVMR
jgi:hypothetical protein